LGCEIERPEDAPPCFGWVGGGELARIAGTRSVRVPGPPVPLAVAVAGTKVALVPADTSKQPKESYEFRPVPGGAVEIRDVRSGAITASFTPAGEVGAIAMTPYLTAVLVTYPDATRIERYATRSGALLAATEVPRSTGALDVSRGTVVFSVNRSIRVLEHATGNIRRLITTRADPIGLSIEGTRVAWAVNAKRRGLIRAIDLGGA
jgi:hypothetical protein